MFERLAREYADKHGLTLHVRSVPDDFQGLGIRDIAWKTRRKPCAGRRSPGKSSKATAYCRG